VSPTLKRATLCGNASAPADVAVELRVAHIGTTECDTLVHLEIVDSASIKSRVEPATRRMFGETCSQSYDSKRTASCLVLLRLILIEAVADARGCPA
jgi:hypothetical protein